MDDSLPPGYVWRVEIDINYLHYCRVSRGWTMRQLAERMQGSIGQLSDTCKRRTCTFHYLERIASTLDINPLSLLVSFPVPEEVHNSQVKTHAQPAATQLEMVDGGGG